MNLREPLSLALAELIESGLSLNVGTRSAERWPETCRAMGLRVHPDRRSFDVFLPVATSSATLANLRDNGLIAVTASHPPTHRTVQLKGLTRQITPESPADREFIVRYRRGLGTVLATVGIQPQVAGKVVHSPCWRVEVELHEVYEQTPGPDAGRPYEQVRRG